MTGYFVFDVESVGLHGLGFAVGGLMLLGDEILWEFSYATEMQSWMGDSDDVHWIRQHLPHLQLTHEGTYELRKAFWAKWQEATQAADKVYAVADCAWPVEANFLSSCILDNLFERKWAGPYPLLDLSSMLLMKGYNPLHTFERLSGENLEHHPLCDARQSARVLSMYVLDGNL